MLRWILRFASMIVLFASAAACVAEGDAGPSAALTTAEMAEPAKAELQPDLATYRCGSDGAITVANMRSSVVLTDPQGESVTLPASPASQQNRYGQTGYALVLEGKEALYMKGGKEPLTCRR